ncbi:MAG: CopD family protein [Phenylobacterium sp.]|uniref:CopD family protein n=1 Tax=Phenylobacterium sp. TaxID=1871053 RepID=UPI002727192B|nr:CopD family protein [Phenylobacterium sp.]MDO8899772.1 CopD family protein [Phenylobacterium sp.]MDP2213729.1 CopD family protein [Phenylobacterium sp.]
MAWLKFLHISALLIWCAGLIYLPGLLLAHRKAIHSEDFVRLRNASRFSYNAITSPAAFVAIAAGTALLLLAPGVLQGWMFVKLGLVGLLVMAHVQYGFVLSALSDAGANPPRLRLLAVWGLVFAAMTAILWLVLEKPFLGSAGLPSWLLEPGGLQSLLPSTPI